MSESLWVFKIEVEWVSEHHKLKEKATTRPHEECFTQTLEKKRKEKKNIVAIMLTRPPLHYSTNSNHPRLLLRSFSPDSLFYHYIYCYSFSIFVFQFTLIGPWPNCPSRYLISCPVVTYTSSYIWTVLHGYGHCINIGYGNGQGYKIFLNNKIQVC